MSSLELATAWGLVAVGMAGSAMCSGMETGLYTINRVRLGVRAGRDDAEANAVRLRHEVDHPDRLLTTLLISNNGFNYIGTLGVTALLATTGLSDIWIIVLQAVVLTPMLLVFGEALPKEFFRHAADSILPRLSIVLVALRWAASVTLVLPLVLTVARLAARSAGLSSIGAVVSGRERLVSLLKGGSGDHALSDTQAGMIDRALRFSRSTAGSEMIPMSLVRTVGADWTNTRARSATARAQFSRYPVRNSSGRIVGILRALDLYLSPDAGVSDLLVEPSRVPPGMSAEEVLVQMRAEQSRIAVVESGGKPIGIVTAKDLIEPLTGELLDW